MATATQDWLGGIDLETIPENVFDTYERSMVPAVFEPWGRRLVETAEIGKGDRVLDVACATGIVARLAAERVGTEGAITGLDLMPGMLDVARTSAAKDQSAIDWVEGDAGTMSLPDGSFDVVLCQQGLQFFPDKVGALREMRRVLAEGGRAIISVWRSIDRSPAVAALQDAIATHASEAAGFLPFAFSYTSRTDLRRDLEEAGFSDISVRIEIGAVRFESIGDYLTTYLGSTPVGGVVASLPRENQIALAKQVTQNLSDYVDDMGFTFPQETHIATARRD
jgi:ubiquinone/menaquinone biosynthesis C-methylase UbiE